LIYSPDRAAVANGLGRLRVSAMKILFWHLTRTSILNHDQSERDPWREGSENRTA
jgi:hypothetical protein